MYKIVLPIILLLGMSGCGSSSSSKETIDLVEYLPASSMIKDYTDVERKDGDINRIEYTENITVEPNLVTTKIDGNTTKKQIITNDAITIHYYGENNRTEQMNRHVSVGSTVLEYEEVDVTEKIMVGAQEVGNKTSTSSLSCKLDSITDEYVISFYEYANFDGEHDIAKIKCTTHMTETTQIYPEYMDLVAYETGTIESKNDIAYLYMQKGYGVVANVNNDCVTSKEPDVIDDTAKESECIGEQYHYVLYYSLY